MKPLFKYFTLFAILYSPFSPANPFETPKELQKHVQFWVQIYTKWESNQVIFFDRENPGNIYRVLKLPKYADFLSDKQYDRITEKVQKRLRKAGHKRVRYQTGLKDRFLLGLKLSGRYRADIEAKLTQAGLPRGLVAMVFVESLFYAPARSRVGAAGLWQFMPGTAKEYMHLNRLVDERFDPIIATAGAIKYLKKAKKDLKTWPLAITSFNYGRYGMKKAVRYAGTRDFAQVLKRYKHRRFGFAAKNYYVEFLAALQIIENQATYFPNAPIDKPWRYELLRLPESIFFSDLLNTKKVSKQKLYYLNPALTRHVKKNREVIPKGYTLRIPEKTKKILLKTLDLRSNQAKKRAARKIRARHKANGRQSILYIARKYDVSYKKLAKRLGSSIYRRPKRGTVIVLRSADSQFTPIY